MAIQPPTIRVLVVDEDKAACDQLEGFLQKEAFEVRTITDPTRAEAEIRKSEFHVLITELAMPKLSGLEVIRRVRKVDTDVAIIVFTASASLDTAREAIRYSVDAYISKPFNPEEFRELLAEVIAKKGLARTPEDQLHRVIGNIIRDLRRDRLRPLRPLCARLRLRPATRTQGHALQRRDRLHQAPLTLL